MTWQILPQPSLQQHPGKKFKALLCGLSDVLHTVQNAMNTVFLKYQDYVTVPGADFCTVRKRRHRTDES